MRYLSAIARWLAVLALPAAALALDYAEISAQPQLWPREVTVRVPVNVPIVSGGQTAGHMQLPAGRTMRLVKVEPTSLTLEMNGARLTVRPSETDLMQRVLTRSAPAAPATPAPAATAVPTPAPSAAVPSATPAAQPAPAVAKSAPAPAPASVANGLPTSPGLHRSLSLPASTLPKPVAGLESKFAGGETFDLFLPKNHDPAKPAGLLVFVPSSDKHIVPEQYAALFDEFGLIVIGLHRAGNSESFARRGGLAVAAARFAQASFRIDPARTLVGGNSGGGRVASRVGQMCADLFSGVVALSSADFHADVIRKDQSNDTVRTVPGFAATPSSPKGVPVSAGQLSAARGRVRFALLGGAEDNVFKSLLETPSISGATASRSSSSSSPASTTAPSIHPSSGAGWFLR